MGGKVLVQHGVDPQVIAHVYSWGFGQILGRKVDNLDAGRTDRLALPVSGFDKRLGRLGLVHSRSSRLHVCKVSSNSMRPANRDKDHRYVASNRSSGNYC
jgi:hypothetical protein